MIPRAGISSTGVLNNVAYGSLVAPTSAQAGFRLDANGKLVTVAYGSLVAPVSREGAFSFDANGALVTVDGGSKVAPVSYSGGFPFDANGALVTSTSAITSSQGGIGYDVLGYITALVSGGAIVGITDNFSGTYPARSDGGTWSTINGTAPVNSAGKLTPGAAAGTIVADLTYQNATYSVDVNTTVGTFTPIMRIFSDGTATTNYVGVAIGTAGDSSAFGLLLFSHVSGTFSTSSCPVSNTAVFTSGVTGTVTVVVTGAPALPSLTVKFNGVTIPSNIGGYPANQGGAGQWAALAGNAGATKCGIEMPASGVTFDNYAAA